MSHLPCPTCQRHVRLSDTTCPFCATVLPVVVPTASFVEPAPRLGRIAVLAAGAALVAAAGLTSCDDPAQPKTGTGGAAATGGKGGSAGGSATGGKGGTAGTAGASGAGGGAGSKGTGGSAGGAGAGGSAGAAATGGAGGVPVAIYAAAVALPSNTA